jgi:glycosyltransferase involved in cell wall biosynthesis
MKLSIVMPVFNALESLKITLHSIINNTDNLYEIILVDDFSDDPTRQFIDNLRLEDNLNCRLIKTRNVTHSWTNASWNMGVKLATGDYIAVLNSDISVNRHWDSALVRLLRTCTIACPYEHVGSGQLIALDPLIAKVHPGMIKGPCFMFSAQYKFDWLFPIPSILTHWCGDNYLADRAEKIKGVRFTKRAIITHGVTHSGRLIKPEEYKRVCTQDVLNYQAFSGRDMSLVLEQIS